MVVSCSCNVEDLDFSKKLSVNLIDKGVKVGTEGAHTDSSLAPLNLVRRALLLCPRL